MEDNKKLFDFYDKILNCLILNTEYFAKKNNRKGYYIPNFNIKDKEDLLLVEIVKIISMFKSESSSLPLLIYYNDFKGFINFLKLKFKLRKTSVKVKKATEEDKNDDFNTNLNFVCKELNFPRVVYEDIYEAYYEKGVKIND